MEATEYGLSNLITILSKTDREKQWKAIYPTNTCLFTYGRDLRSCVIIKLKLSANSLPIRPAETVCQFDLKFSSGN